MTTFRSTMTTTFLIAALLLDVANAQFDFQASTEACPSDDSITGYTSIVAMNTDMQSELDRIGGGAAVDPDRRYSMIICPMTTFDTTTETLMPVINGAEFRCGTDGDVANSCVFSGGGENVDIQESTVDGYTISTVYFEGLTFEQFTGRSIDLEATDETTATFVNSLWQVCIGVSFFSSFRIEVSIYSCLFFPQNFATNIVFRVRNNNGPTGNLEVIGSTISVGLFL
jgi:hypothetical protein